MREGEKGLCGSSKGEILDKVRRRWKERIWESGQLGMRGSFFSDKVKKSRDRNTKKKGDDEMGKRSWGGEALREKGGITQS